MLDTRELPISKPMMMKVESWQAFFTPSLSLSGAEKSQVEMIIKGLETDNQELNGEMYPRLDVESKML
jgi:hypothetical protein